jgi:hypothetical protein
VQHQGGHLDRPENGGCRLENGGCRPENGGWAPGSRGSRLHASLRESRIRAAE